MSLARASTVTHSGILPARIRPTVAVLTPKMIANLSAVIRGVWLSFHCRINSTFSSCVSFILRRYYHKVIAEQALCDLFLTALGR